MDYKRVLKAIPKGRTLVSFHSGGDIDAVASAISLSKLLGDAQAAAPDGLHSSALRLLERLGYPMPLLSEVDADGFDNLLLVDGREPAVFGRAAGFFEKFPGPRLVIDHHDSSNSLRGFIEFVEGRSSCSEIIYRLWRASGRKIPQDAALLLACGIMSDSYFFASADSDSLDAFNYCLKAARTPYSAVYGLCASAPDVSQKIAVVKSVRDSVVIRKGGTLLAYAESRGFEHATATALVACGCDVAFALNFKRGLISCVKSPLFKAANCGRLMQAAGAAMNGSGGGHENAGGAGGEPKLVKRGLEAALALIA